MPYERPERARTVEVLTKPTREALHSARPPAPGSTYDATLFSGMPRYLEATRGVFVGPGNTGTNPPTFDSDGGTETADLYRAREHNVRIWKFTPGGPGAIGAGVNSWFGRLRSAPESAIRALVIDFNEALGTAANAHALPQIQGTQLLTGLRGPERSGQGRSRRTRESRTRFAA